MEKIGANDYFLCLASVAFSSGLGIQVSQGDQPGLVSLMKQTVLFHFSLHWNPYGRTKEEA